MAGDDTSSLWKTIGRLPLFVLFRDSRNVLNRDELGLEIANIAIPATLALMADPIASLIDTAFIGRIGVVELASVGVSVAIFNQVSRITMFPLVSITTSFVAEEEAISKSSSQEEEEEEEEEHKEEEEEDGEDVGCNHDDDDQEKVPLTGSKDIKITKTEDKRRHVASASSAMVVGCILGILQTLFLIFTAKPLLLYMGVKPESPMLKVAEQYLTLRSLGAPAILLSLSAQGVFRGLKDTKTPLYAIVIGDTANIILDPILIFTLHLGVNGAAIAHVVAQYLIFLVLIWRLVEKVVLLPPNFKELQLGRFLKSGFQLLIKVISATSCMTVAASLAARLGPKPMAAFQVCLQIWLATSLLADGLAVAGQAILASAFAKKDYERTVAVASRVLQIGVILGLLLSFILASVSQFASNLFTKDVDVLKLMNISFPFIAVTQPINALAFVFDGVNYGAADFAYSAYTMVMVAVMSISCLFILSASHGYIGIWIALTIFMCLRVLAGLLRIGTGMGPWSFLRS
ncbi:hypothetical protein V6N11_020045 [Hibiscus sabdariffa]|uniref:Protein DETOXIFICATION n=1 Tax=Hibiscus sabdariffa TaxID=183260 RepID=A0ABR2P8F2_9ROSI